MFYCYKLDSDNNLNINFADLLKKAIKFLKAKKKLIDLVWINKKSNRIEDLVDKCEKKTQIGSVINYFTFLLESAFQPPVFIPIITIYFGTTDSQLVDRKIDQLIKMMQVLALSVRTLQGKTGLFRKNPRPITALVISSSLQLLSEFAFFQKQDWSKKMTKCFHC